MDGFGDDFVTKEEDPAADFLAREQNDLAGLEDDLATQPEAIEESDIISNDIITNDIVTNDIVTNDIVTNDIVTNDIVTNDIVTNDFVTNDIIINERNNSDTTPSPVPVREEPEKIKIWREEQAKRLEEKDEAEEKSKAELHEKAKQELEEWYQQHEEQITRTRQANRSAEKELVADTTRMVPGTEWERIAKLCDFNPKTAKSSRDISRMRSIILQVKQNPPIKT